MHELESKHTNHSNLHSFLWLTSQITFCGEAGIPLCVWYHLSLSLFPPPALSLLIPSSKSRQHNCKHIYCTLESHSFPPPISFYYMAPVFCFSFFRTSNKALTSLKEGEELVPPSSLAKSITSQQNTIISQQWGKMQYQLLLANDYVCFLPSQKLPSVLDGFYEMPFYLWAVKLELASPGTGDGRSKTHS